MSKLIGFVGAHRTGKTTLAAKVGKELGLPFVPTALSDALRKMGVDPQSDMSFAERIEVQNVLLLVLLNGYQRCLKEYPDAPAILVDRTPMDILAYTGSEILRSTLDAETSRRFAWHRAQCYSNTAHNFQHLFLVQPGIPIVADTTKATPNVHYQRHINAVMLEAVLSPANTIDTLIMDSKNTRIDSRVSLISKYIVDTIYKQQKQTFTIPPTNAIN